MGSSRFVTYVITIKMVSGAFHTPAEWKIRSRYGCKGYGNPTVANIDKWVTAFEKSMRQGGYNYPIGIDQVIEAKIVHQSTDTILTVWKRHEQRKNQPMFEVIS